MVRVSGTLEGHRQGLYVVDVSNISMVFTCTFPSCLGPSSLPDGLSINTMAWNYETHFWDASLAPIISFDESLNNFQLINQAHYPPDFDASTLRYFEMHTVDPLYPYGLPPVSAQDSTVSRGDGELELNGSWRLTQANPPVAAVPEPSTMLLLGLGIVALAVKQRFTA